MKVTTAEIRLLALIVDRTGDTVEVVRRDRSTREFDVAVHGRSEGVEHKTWLPLYALRVLTEQNGDGTLEEGQWELFRQHVLPLLPSGEAAPGGEEKPKRRKKAAPTSE